MEMDEKEKKKRVRETNFILVAFLFSGTAALIYEVVWTRALSLVLGSSVYALSTMLSTFMAGLALGAFICGRFCDRTRNLLFAFGLCELGIGVSGLVSIPVIYSLPSLYLYVYRSFHVYPTLFFMFQVFICVIVMLVPTVLMGATFPLVSRKITESIEEVGNKVARAYSLNTMGAVLGSLAAGFFLIPAVGLNGTAMVAALLNTAVALTMLVISGRKALRPISIALPLLVLSAAWAGNAEPKTCFVNFHTARRIADNISYDTMAEAEKDRFKEVYYEEHPEGQVKAFVSKKGELLLLVGGKLEGTGIGDIPNMLLAAYLPTAAHPRRSNFLNIGLGAGVTLAAARSAVPDVDVVEINPGVIRAVQKHGISGILDGVGIIENDARNYLMRTKKKYDIISSEPSYPTDAGSSNLFTREFFELAATRLSQYGIFGQWLPYYLMSNEDLRMMVKTFGTVFPYTYVWKVHGSHDVIMIGSKEPFFFSLEEIEENVEEIDSTGYNIRYQLFFTPEDVRGIVNMEDVPVNSDDRPLLEFCIVNNIIAAK
jgi:spermidine synthase